MVKSPVNHHVCWLNAYQIPMFVGKITMNSPFSNVLHPFLSLFFPANSKALILSQWGYPAANVPSMRLTLDRLAQRAQQLGARRASPNAAAAPSRVGALRGA